MHAPHPMRLRSALLCSALLVALPALAQEIPSNMPMETAPKIQAALPHIVLMSMGGTIASRASTRLNITSYGGKGVPRVDPADWIHDLPELANIARVSTEDFRPPEDRPTGMETFEDLEMVREVTWGGAVLCSESQTYWPMMM